MTRSPPSSSKQRRRRLALVADEAVRVVLEHGHAVRARPARRRAADARSRACARSGSGRSGSCRGSSSRPRRARARARPGRALPRPSRTGTTSAPSRGEDLQRPIVGRRLDEHAARALGEQLLGVEDEALQPAVRDDHAGRRRPRGGRRASSAAARSRRPGRRRARTGRRDRPSARSRRAARRRGTPAPARHGRTRSCGTPYGGCGGADPAATLFLTDGVVSSCEVCSSSVFPVHWHRRSRQADLVRTRRSQQLEYAVFP